MTDSNGVDGSGESRTLEQRVAALEAENEQLRERAEAAIRGKQTRRKVLGALAGGGLLAGAASGSASAATWSDGDGDGLLESSYDGIDVPNVNGVRFVGDDGFSSIQAAIDDLPTRAQTYDSTIEVPVGKVLIQADYQPTDNWPVTITGNVTVQGQGQKATILESGTARAFHIDPPEDVGNYCRVCIRDLSVHNSTGVARIYGGANHLFENVQCVKSDGGRAFLYNCGGQSHQSVSATFKHVTTHDAGLIRTVNEQNNKGNNALRFFGCYASYSKNPPVALNHGDTDVTMVGCVLQWPKDAYYAVVCRDPQSFKMYGGYAEFDTGDVGHDQWLVGSMNQDNYDGDGGTHVTINGTYINGATGAVRTLDENDRINIQNVEYVNVGSALANVNEADTVYVDEASCHPVPGGSEVPPALGDDSVVRTSGGRYVAQDLAASGAPTGDFVGDRGYHEGSTGQNGPAYWDGSTWRSAIDGSSI